MLYDYKCDCGAVKQIESPMLAERGKQVCECGREMWQVFTANINPHFLPTGRDKVLATLNREEDGYKYPGGEMYGERYDQAMAKGLERDGQPGQYGSGVPATSRARK